MMGDMIDNILNWVSRIVFVIGGLIILDSVLADGAGVLYFGIAVAYVAALAFQSRWLASMREDLKERSDDD